MPNWYSLLGIQLYITFAIGIPYRVFPIGYELFAQIYNINQLSNTTMQPENTSCFLANCSLYSPGNYI